MEFTYFLPLPSFITVLFFLFCSLSLVSSQQPYIGRNTTRCTNFTSPPPFPSSSSDFGYSCNGINQTCETYLIYRSYPPYNTIPAVSKLLSVDPVRLSEINSVPLNVTIDTNRMLIIPVVCSCSGQYYQANTSYVVQPGDTYYLIVNGTYQGLASCRALKHQNPIETVYIYTGTNFTIPLRCACPTKNQTDKGIRYLLTYVVAANDFVSRISARFGVDTGRTLTANGLTEQNNLIFAFSTLLVPLQNKPLVSQTISPPPPPSQQPSSQQPLPMPSPANWSRTKWVYAIFGFLAGNAFVLVIGSVVLFKFLPYCIKVKSEKPNGVPEALSIKLEASEGPTIKEISGEESKELRMNISNIAQSIKVYCYEELEQATNNFSSICCIKGSVYRGMIDGSYVAVKEMSGDAIKEINILNKISHFNIIRLVGICFNDGRWYFVFEHATKGPLSDWIYRSGVKIDGEILSWNHRIQIALDIAMGLNYLHCFTTPPLIHQNITSSNVLLDENFRAKITNFSTARPAKGDEGEFAMTLHIMGTKGYLAPEYLENGLVSTKLDVYAFGVLLMEMITGKDIEELLGEGRTNLFEIVSDVIQSDDEEGIGNKSGDLVDPCLGRNYPDHQTIVLMKVIRQCLWGDPGGRPAMDEVVQSLSTVLTCSSIWESSCSFSF